MKDTLPLSLLQNPTTAEPSMLGSALSTSLDSPATPTELPPMLEHYHTLKQNYPHHFLFYRLGDFYELFFQDAISVSSILGLTLTHRNPKNAKVPMCGVPLHTLEVYLARLLAQGYKVALCEQTETPEQAKAARGSKALVKREVVRLYTPGTLVEEGLISSVQHQYLACLWMQETALSRRLQKDPNATPQELFQAHRFALSWIDVSLGEPFVERLESHELLARLTQLKPRELLISALQLASLKNALGGLLEETVLSPIPEQHFSKSHTHKTLCHWYDLEQLDSLQLHLQEIQTLGALFTYLELTQAHTPEKSQSLLRSPKSLQTKTCLTIDETTQENLYLFPSTSRLKSQEQNKSLLEVVDFCKTAAGQRLLGEWMRFPLLSCDLIKDRQAATNFLHQKRSFLEQIQQHLPQSTDGERALLRLLTQRGKPQDLLRLTALAQSCYNLSQAQQTLFSINEAPLALKQALSHLEPPSFLLTLPQQLSDELPALFRRPGLFKYHAFPELEQWDTELKELHSHLESLQQTLIQELDTPQLKIKENGNLGFFIEVPPRFAKPLLEHPAFTQRQSLLSAVRFEHPELRRLETEIRQRQELCQSFEEHILAQLLQQLQESRESILQLCQKVALLDVFQSAATLLNQEGWTHPTLDQSKTLRIQDGWHPLLPSLPEQRSTPTIIKNDCALSEDTSLYLITGPNMAGKSTYLKQNALIILLAQMGLSVPAANCHLGVVDHIFSRIGAGDKLHEGQSTFMVEMMETARICRGATTQSFVIFDEIGRGTSVTDGQAIAQATLEFVHNEIQCRTLFATHFHQLTHLSETLPQLQCMTLQTQEWQQTLIFLYKLIPGVCSESFGIHVGKLAGLPTPLLDRAQTLLQQSYNPAPASQPTPFTEAIKTQTFIESPNAIALENQKLLQQLKQYQALSQRLNSKSASETTPLEALTLLSELQDLFTSSLSE